MPTRTVLGSILTCLLIAACSAQKPPILGTAPTYERGLQFFPSPRTFDPPGTVFRIDPDGVGHPIVDLSTLLPIETGQEAVPQMSATSVLRLSLLLNWIGLEVGGEISEIDSATVYLGGAVRERAFEVDLRAVVDSARKIVDWDRPGSVYLITETVSADTVGIRLSRSFAAALGEALAEKGDAIGTGIRWRPQEVTQLHLRFDTPHRVLYKAKQLVRRFGGLEVDSASEVVLVDVEEPISWDEPEEPSK